MALLDSGRVVAKGTPDYIKRRFGIGYNLTVNHEISPGLQTEVLAIPGAALEQTSDSTCHFTLPFQAVESFSGLFAKLEQRGIRFSLR